MIDQLVTRKELKERLRILHDYEDALIDDLLVEAQDAAEAYCRTEFEEDTAPEAVRMAIMLYAGYFWEKRSAPDKNSYEAMRRAFHDMLGPNEDPEKMF